MSRNVAVEVLRAGNAAELEQLVGKATKWWKKKELELIWRMENAKGTEGVRVDVWNKVDLTEPDFRFNIPFGEWTTVLIFAEATKD